MWDLYDYDALELYGKIALQAIIEYTNHINNGLTFKVIDGLNMVDTCGYYAIAIGHAMFHDSVCEMFPEYIGSKQYEQNLIKITKATEDFICKATKTGLDIATHHNFSRIKLFLDFIDCEYKETHHGASIYDEFEGFKEFVKDAFIGSAQAGEFDFSNTISKGAESKDAEPKDTTSKTKKFAEKEFEKRIDKSKLTEEEKKELKENPQKIKKVIEEKLNKVNKEFSDKIEVKSGSSGSRGSGSSGSGSSGSGSSGSGSSGSWSLKEKRDFVHTVGELGETAYLLGTLTNSKEIISSGVIAMNTCKIADNVLCAIGSGLTIGNVNGILSGILSLSTFFGRKSNPYEAIFSSIRGIQQMLQNIHQDMINNFVKVFKELGEIKTSIIMNFKNLDIDIAVIDGKLNYISTQIQSIDNKLTETHTDITEKFKSLSDRITLDDVSTKRTQFISKITEINMRDSDMFEESMRDLLTLINVEDETLCGFKDITNNSRMLGRLTNLDVSFNICTFLEIAKKYSHCLVLASDIEKYMSTLPKNEAYPINKILMIDMIYENSFENIGIYPLYNQGIWSLYVKTVDKTALYAYSSDTIFEKLTLSGIKIGMFAPTDSNISFCDSGLYICKIVNCIVTNKNISVNHKQYEKITLTSKDICQVPVKLSSINNPLCYTICLNEICNQIEKQRKDGNLPMGFISGVLFSKLTKLIESNSYYYDLVLFFRNKELMKSVLQDYKKAYMSVSQEIEKGKKEYFTKFSLDLNLSHKTRMLKLLKKKTEEFRNQQIDNFTYFVNMWFYCSKNHHSGKFAGSDSRSGDINNAICAEQHHARDAHINHMKTLFENGKKHLSEQILDLYTNKAESYWINNSLGFEEYIGRTHKYLIPYIYHVNHKKEPNKYPILSLSNIDMSHDTLFLHQKLFGNEHNQNWLVEFYYNIVEKADKKQYFVLEAKINNLVIYSGEKLYEPLFYKDKEAIWFYWYGGNINMDGGSHTRQWNDCYTDNVCTYTLYYPYYTSRNPSWFDILSDSQKHINCHNWHEIHEANEKKVNEYLEIYNEKVRKRTLTVNLPKVLDNLDIWYKIIKNMGLIAGIKEDIFYSNSKVYPSSKYFKSGEDFVNYCLLFNNALLNNVPKNKYYLFCEDLDFKLWDSSVLTLWDKSKSKFPETWINSSGVEQKFINLITEVIPLITSRYSPSDKEKWTQEMNEILIKILEVGQNSPDCFASFDLLGFIKSVKKSWEDKVKSGTVKGNFKSHAIESLLLLTNGNKVLNALCL